MNPEFDDLENKSDISDGPFTKSVGSSSSNHLEGTIQPGEPCSGVWSSHTELLMLRHALLNLRFLIILF